jgi:hypothetical protein
MSKTKTRIRILLDWDQDAKHAIIWAADKTGLIEEISLRIILSLSYSKPPTG